MKIYYHDSGFGSKSYFLISDTKYQIKIYETFNSVVVFKFEKSDLHVPSTAKKIETPSVLKFILKRVFEADKANLTIK